MNAVRLDTARDVFDDYGDAAWLLADAGPSASGDNGPIIYICDVRSGRVLLLPTAAGALEKLYDQTQLDEPGYHEIRTATSILISDVLESKAGIHPDTRRGLILGAAFCVTQTRGFHITKHHGSDVQYLLVRYPDIASGTHVLVPMPQFKPNPITVPDLESSVMHILSSEQVNHPDRFVGSRSLQFTQSRRSVVAAGASRAA